MREPGWFIRLHGQWVEAEPVEYAWWTRTLICDMCVWGSLFVRFEGGGPKMLCPRCAKKRGLKW